MRIVEFIDVKPYNVQLDEGLWDKGAVWLAKSLPFLKGTASAGIDAGKILAKPLVKGGGAVVKGTANTVIKPAAFGAGLGAGTIGAGYLAAKDAIGTLVQWGKDLVNNLNISPEVLEKIGEYASQYGLPVLAAVAIMYGGKKVYDWLASGDDEKETHKAIAENYFAERGAAPRALCLSKRSDASLGASQLASCKSQGLRARDGNKSHKLGKKRVKVGGHKIKGKAHGGPLPDWS